MCVHACAFAHTHLLYLLQTLRLLHVLAVAKAAIKVGMLYLHDSDFISFE